MPGEDLGERTEEATPKRKREAREEGNIARSVDFGGALVLLGGTIACWLAAAYMLSRGGRMLVAVLGDPHVARETDAREAIASLAEVGLAAVLVMLPVVLGAWGTALLAQLTQVGLVLTPKALQPKLERLDPIKGAQRILGIRGLVKVGLDTAKVALVAVLGAVTIAQYLPTLIGLPAAGLRAGLTVAASIVLDMAIRVAVLLLVLGLIDLLYQRHRHAEELKMTKQQVKDEMKNTEGDPETKRRRMQVQQQIASQRVAAAVPTATVVVRNPEHFSVAIRYDGETMRAPVVVAKGADHLALRIRQIAARNQIPVIERKPLARALYRGVEVGQEIPPEFYKAVAEILAYVYRLTEPQRV